MEFCAALLHKVRENGSAPICMCNEMYKTLQEQEDVIYEWRHNSVVFQLYRVFLRAAIKHNHLDLLNEMLSNRRYDVNLLWICNPFFVAISSGNLEVVKIFLRSRPELTVLTKYCFSVSSAQKRSKRSSIEIRLDEWSRVGLSVVECACLCDQRDILKLLVAYVMKQKRCLDCPFIDSSVDACHFLSCSDHAQVSLIHTAIGLLTKDCFRKMLTLPSIVQLMLDAGADVNARHRGSDSALHHLTKEILCLRASSADVSADECSSVVETARILLAAGSVTTGYRENTPLGNVMELYYVRLNQLLDSNSLVISDNISKMGTDIIKLLLRHGALKLNEDASSRVQFHKFIQESSLCLLHGRSELDAVTTTKFDALADNVSDIFNYLLLTSADIMRYLWLSDGKYCPQEQFNSRRLFQIAFVYLAGYSSECARSSELLRLMLNGFSASQVQQLRMSLARLIEQQDDFILSLTEVRGDCTRNALEWIDRVEVPYSLMHLSCRAITRAMSYRCLDAKNVSTLRLPRNTEVYIGYYYMPTNRVTSVTN